LRSGVPSLRPENGLPLFRDDVHAGAAGDVDHSSDRVYIQIGAACCPSLSPTFLFGDNVNDVRARIIRRVEQFGDWIYVDEIAGHGNASGLRIGFPVNDGDRAVAFVGHENEIANRIDAHRKRIVTGGHIRHHLGSDQVDDAQGGWGESFIGQVSAMGDGIHRHIGVVGSHLDACDRMG